MENEIADLATKSALTLKKCQDSINGLKKGNKQLYAIRIAKMQEQ